MSPVVPLGPSSTGSRVTWEAPRSSPRSPVRAERGTQRVQIGTKKDATGVRIRWTQFSSHLDRTSTSASRYARAPSFWPRHGSVATNCAGRALDAVKGPL
jgi:hypothetical protein